MAGIEAAAVGGLGSIGGLSDAWAQQMLSGADATRGIDSLGSIDGIEGALAGTDATTGLDFGAVLGRNLASLEATDKVAQTKAVEAATGDLTDIHDYVIAAQEAQVATELTTTIRNKALEAFNDIMRMPL
jgi:flagellar hook-basal body complex protein FliE